MEPISFLDQLVKGVILAAYDFVRLTLAGFVIPFVRGRRHFWTTVISTQTRLSSLTYLVLWVLLTVSIASQSSRELASSVAGLAKASGRDIPSSIVLALLISILIDVIIRLSISAFHNRVGREMYEGLTRIAVANVFFGACLIMVTLPPPKNDPLAALFGPIASLMGPVPRLPNLIVLPFCISLAIVWLKATSSVIRGRITRASLGLLIVVLVPILLWNLAIPLYDGVRKVVDTISPGDDFVIYAAYQRCRIDSNKIHASAYLRLAGIDVALVKARDFGIYEFKGDYDNGEALVGRPDDDEVGISISDKAYTRVDLVADYKPPKSTSEASNCEVRIFTNSALRGRGDALQLMAAPD
jgi:hypothetical protein